MIPRKRPPIHAELRDDETRQIAGALVTLLQAADYSLSERHEILSEARWLVSALLGWNKQHKSQTPRKSQ